MLTEAVLSAPHRTTKQDTRRPRLLFLARGFPPARTPSCTRTWNVAKYLTRLGWQITVVTVDPAVWRQTNDPLVVERRLQEEGIERILTDHRLRCLGYDEFKYWNKGLGRVVGAAGRSLMRHLALDNGIGWIRAAEQACSKLRAGDVDIILATAPPASAFRLADRLSTKLGCPYVMDYRDPWTQNPHKALAAHPKRIKEESRLLERSAAVTIVSRAWADALERQHGLGSKLHVISNGYDPEALTDVTPMRFDHFAIVYAGRFYSPKRVITPIMKILSVLKQRESSSPPFRFHYYGPHQEHVYREAEKCGVLPLVLLHGEVSHATALGALRGAGLAVVITSVDESGTTNDQGIVTGKIFEPISLNVPILLISPPGSDAEQVLREEGLGKAFRGGDIKGMVEFISELMAGGSIQSGPALNHSWPNIAVRLNRLLRGVLDANAGRN